jgi:signal transduction histidine kinase
MSGALPPARRGAPVVRLLQSAGFRFALLFALMFAAAGIAFLVVLWWNTAGALDRQGDAAVRTDALALVERWRDAGVAGLVEAIDDRLATDIEGESIYLLVSPAGRRLAGNLDRWPEEMPAEAAWSYAPVARAGVATEVRLHRVDLGSGHRLLVGRDVAEKLRLRTLLAEGLAWSGAVAAAFALIGALALRRSVETRLRPAFATAAAIADGDLSQRIPLSSQDDEFDHLALTMNAMLDRIDRLMQGVRGVSDAIAHDLRTPIARARTRLEGALAEAREGEAPQLRAAVEQAIAELDGVTRVFQALLRIAEAEAGARRAAFAPLDLAALLGDAAELYGAAAEARGQVLETELPDTLPMVGDRDLLLQAVANLLDNAVKFTPPGGRVTLAARRGAEGLVEVEIADDGPGLDAADRARAGERFFRADAARATPGSGLGLSLVRAVAMLHGGELRLADARPGRAPPGLRAVLRLASG